MVWLVLVLIACSGAENSDETVYKAKIAAATDQIACDVCKEAVGDVWEKSRARKERGDETDEERLEKYVDSRCTSQGLEDDYTIGEDGETFTFRAKNMEDYQAEGGVVETVTNPDGS